MRTFKEALEQKEGGKPLPTPINMGSKDNEFKPFIVKRDSDEGAHSNLSILIDAFNKSGEVKLHKTIRNGQTEWQTLPKKKLYLVGGAVRDHLLNKTPKDLDLTTDATPDEIRLILKNAGFTETESQGGKHKKSRIDFVEEAPKDKNKIFYAKGWDQQGNEFVIGAKVNGEEFEIATFRSDSKASDGRTPEKMSFSDLPGDAARRDFDINAMYIELGNADGPNNKLIDMFGGAHSVKDKKVKWVGKAEDRLQEDFLRALRYIRMVSRYGDPKTVSAEELRVISKYLPQIEKSVSSERIRDEFLKGLEHNDVDPVEYIKLYKKTGLLPIVFPGMQFELEAPEHFSRERYRPLAIAWLLRKNEPNVVKNMLKQANWTNVEANDVAYLLNTLKMKEHTSTPEGLAKLKAQHASTSFTGEKDAEKLKRWYLMHKKPTEELEKFVRHAAEPRIKATVQGPEGETWNPVFNRPDFAGWKKTDLGKMIDTLEFEKFRS